MCRCSSIRRALPKSPSGCRQWLARQHDRQSAETTIALSHLIFEGTLDKFPGLKVIAAHGGGFLPSYADRSDHACMVGPAGCNPDVKLAKKPTEYLKQLYFNSLIFSPEAIRHLAAQVGASQIVLGSNYPIPGIEARRPYLRLHFAQRRAEGGGAGRHGGEAVQHQRLRYLATVSFKRAAPRSRPCRSPSDIPGSRTSITPRRPTMLGSDTVVPKRGL